MPQDDTSLSTTNPDLSVAERRVLDRIFQHPLSHNLSWRDVMQLFGAAGSVEHARNGTLVLKLGPNRQAFETARDQPVSADEVVALRHLLDRAGMTPAPNPMTSDPTLDAARVVIIDHANARIYDLPPQDARQVPHETHRLHHTIDRTDHDADREETWPVDKRFFDGIAAALEGHERIVVIGHGKGQSNEADHLMAYLFKHHSAVHAHVVREIVANLPHQTVPQLLALARHAMQPAQKTARPEAG